RTRFGASARTHAPTWAQATFGASARTRSSIPTWVQISIRARSRDVMARSPYHLGRTWLPALPSLLQRARCASYSRATIDEEFSPTEFPGRADERTTAVSTFAAAPRARAPVG